MNPQVPTLSVYLDATNLDEPMYRKNILNVEDQGSDLSVLYILWLTPDTALFWNWTPHSEVMIHEGLQEPALKSIGCH